MVMRLLFCFNQNHRTRKVNLACWIWSYFSAEMALRSTWVNQLLMALACVHSKGYAHCDLKAENFFYKKIKMDAVILSWVILVWRLKILKLLLIQIISCEGMFFWSAPEKTQWFAHGIGFGHNLKVYHALKALW